MYKPRMTHPEIRAMHEQLLADAGRGVSLAELATKYERTPETVLSILRSSGIPASLVPHPRVGRERVYRVIAALLRGEKPIDIGIREQVTREAIYSVVRRCLRHGIPIPTNHRRGGFAHA